jgi:hypothetical protein
MFIALSGYVGPLGFCTDPRNHGAEMFHFCEFLCCKKQKKKKAIPSPKYYAIIQSMRSVGKYPHILDVGAEFSASRTSYIIHR